MLVSDIRTEHVLDVLKPIWTAKAETATRVRGRIEQVLDCATVQHYRSGPNLARWKGHLDALLARLSKFKEVEHHAALAIDDVPGFMAQLRLGEGMGARALEFAILTAARSGEVRLATWAEIDLDSAVWTVPAERMKTGREHRVPLSARALDLLRSLPRGDQGDQFVFPSQKGTPLSDMTLTAVLRRMKVDAVPHDSEAASRTGQPNAPSIPTSCQKWLCLT